MLRTVLIYTSLLAAADATARTVEYTVTLTEDLGRADVEARFPAGIAGITARHRGAKNYLLEAIDCGTGEAVAVSAGTMRFGDATTCLSYSVDLRKARDAARQYATLPPGTVLLPVDVWFWRPRLGQDDEIRVAFELPAGIRASVPWQPVEGATDVYRVRSSPASGTALSLFGAFEQQTVTVAGSELRIAAISSARRPVTPDVVEWTRKTAEHVTLAYGRFPNPDARVLLFPVANWRSDSAVPFGRVIRSDGETVELLVDPRKSEEEFLGAWTATHEFSHLLLPYINRDERWISEGFAQYYQNVLLARAGRYSEADAWQKIVAGLERGEEAVPALSPNAAASSDERGTRMKIYWSGAALFLMADVELRRRSQGAVSLDTVLDRFQSCCLPSRRSWTGRELFETFDLLIDDHVFVTLHERYADTQGFPPFRPLLGQLGIVAAGGATRFDDTAELADIRAAITARRYTGSPGD